MESAPARANEGDQYAPYFGSSMAGADAGLQGSNDNALRKSIAACITRKLNAMPRVLGAFAVPQNYHTRPAWRIASEAGALYHGATPGPSATPWPAAAAVREHRVDAAAFVYSTNDPVGGPSPQASSRPPLSLTDRVNASVLRRSSLPVSVVNAPDSSFLSRLNPIYIPRFTAQLLAERPQTEGLPKLFTRDKIMDHYKNLVVPPFDPSVEINMGFEDYDGSMQFIIILISAHYTKKLTMHGFALTDDTHEGLIQDVIPEVLRLINYNTQYTQIAYAAYHNRNWVNIVGFICSLFYGM